MQNRYAGDVGDFSKFGLLRQIADSGLSIGLNWYLVPDETHNEDGKHTGFLTDKRFDGCDDELRDALARVVKNERSVAKLEEQELIRGAVYYDKLLSPPATKDFSRDDWHKDALEKFSKSSIVFLDPDNGILVKSVRPNSSKSIKYVLHGEIKDYYSNLTGIA